MQPQSPCCQLTLVPLLQRIATLEHQLTQEVERRENEYNALLKEVIRRSPKPPSNTHTQQPIPIRRPSRPQRKQSSPILRVAAPAVQQVRNRETEGIPLSLSSPQTMNRLASALSPSWMAQTEKQMASLSAQVVRQGQQLQKGRQLSQYLMDQMLSVFERLKEEDLVRSRKILTEETLPSLVFENDGSAQSKQEGSQNIKIINKQRSAQVLGQEGEVAGKLAEHQTILSDLIRLTRELARQIKSLTSKEEITF